MPKITALDNIEHDGKLIKKGSSGIELDEAVIQALEKWGAVRREVEEAPVVAEVSKAKPKATRKTKIKPVQE